jgi:hypothetical protein
MGKHETTPRLWPAVLGLLAVLCVLAAIALLAVDNPKWGQTPTCRYMTHKVTLVISGPDCSTVIQTVADNNDDAHVWISTDKARGRIYAQLQRGPDTVRVFEDGNKSFAATMSQFFQARKWIVERPTPAPGN